MYDFVLAIDPGDEHVGWASWPNVQCGEWGADEALAQVDQRLARLEDRVSSVLILEEFRLYPGKAGPQSYSDFKTPQMIGALKWIAQTHEVKVEEQGAAIKKPMRAQLRARGVHQVASGSHARDAELHLYYYLYNNGLLEGKNVA